MRIIHTSDWHLGQNFMGKSRASEHAAFLHWLQEQIEQHKVDALIVAGDIFDTGAPPSYAREMYNRFIVDIQHCGCELVVLGGNHDSVAMLNESRELLARLNTHVVSGVMDDPEKQIIKLTSRHTESAAIVCAAPFIRPRDVLVSKADQSSQDKQTALQQAISDHYDALYQRALHHRDQYRKKTGSNLPIIATGHLTTVGASLSDSVRDIYIGTLDAFPASAFPPADYIALGHIHQSQKVAKSEHIRYSGSPIALSFDEARKSNKSVLLVDFKNARFEKAEPLEIPRFQAMQSIRGDLKSIESQLKKIGNDFAGNNKHNENGNSIWVEIEVSSQDYLNDLQQRIDQITENLPLEVLRLRRERKTPRQDLQSVEKESLNELDVMDVFERRLEDEDFSDPEQQARLQQVRLKFKRLVDELKNAADQT